MPPSVPDYIPISSPNRETIVVCGLGMVGLRFCEKVLEMDTEKRFEIVVFCEEDVVAYNRGR